MAATESPNPMMMKTAMASDINSPKYCFFPIHVSSQNRARRSRFPDAVIFILPVEGACPGITNSIDLENKQKDHL